MTRLTDGYDTTDARHIWKLVSESGLVDFVDLDVAVEPNQPHIGMPTVLIEPHVYRPYVEAVRTAAGKIPVLSVLGRLTSIADAEAALAAGVCDVVGASRALIAEPDLVRNACEGQEERSRTRIACNWCLAGLYDGAAGCAINPASYRERVWGPDALVPAPHKFARYIGEPDAPQTVSDAYFAEDDPMLVPVPVDMPRSGYT